jgi:hypothetical protein
MGLFGRKINVTKTRQEIAEAEAENARAETYLAEEQMEKEKVESELDYQRRIDQKERQDLAAADTKLRDIVITGTNEINDLIQISKILKDLAGVRDEGKVLRLKQAYQQQLVALSSVMQPRQMAINDLKKIVEDIRNIDHAEVNLDTDIANMTRSIERFAIKGGVPKSDKKRLAQAQLIATKGVNLANQKEQEVERVEKELNLVIKSEIMVTNFIQEAITDIHNNDFPAAYIAINKAIVAAKKNETLCTSTEGLLKKIRDILDQRLREFSSQLNKLIGRP